MRPTGALGHLLHFHLRTGVRVALRTLVPVAGAAVVGAVLGGSAMTILGPIAAVAFPGPPSLPASAATALILTSIAAALAPRLTTGVGGWARHLPASAVDQRRAVTAGLVAALTPVVLLVVAAGLASLAGPYAIPCAVRLVGLPLLVWGAALAALPVSWRWRLAAVAGATLAGMGDAWAVPAAVVLVAAAEAGAGALREGAAAGAGRRRPGSGGPHAGWLRISTRALGARLLGAWALAAAMLVPAWLFLANNDLDPARRLLVVRLATLVAAVVAVAAIVETLVVRRPPWPWVRSLPWSAARRCGLDALLLAAVAAPVALCALLFEPRTAPAVLVLQPWLALRGAAAIRGDRDRSTGAAGQLLAEGGLTAGLVALQPWLAAVAIVLLPAALAAAAEAERAQDVSRWHELHHLAAGDPLSWGDR